MSFLKIKYFAEDKDEFTEPTSAYVMMLVMIYTLLKLLQFYLERVKVLIANL